MTAWELVGCHLGASVSTWPSGRSMWWAAPGSIIGSMANLACGVSPVSDDNDENRLVMSLVPTYFFAAQCRPWAAAVRGDEKDEAEAASDATTA